MKIAVLGLGNMGSPIAENLVTSGHEVTVWNRSAGRIAPLVAAGAKSAARPAEAVRGVEAAITMVSDDPAVDSISAEMFDALPAASVHVSMSTISEKLSRELERQHSGRMQLYVAAPVFGRPDAAKAKKLWIVAAGARDSVERCRPIFDSIGQGTFVVGERPHLANVVKLAGNFMLASAIEALGEAFALTSAAGVERAAFLEIISSLFASPVYKNYGGLVANNSFEPGFKLKLGLKDVRLALASADAANVPMPLGSLLRDHFLTALNHGMGDLDWSALGKLAAENAATPEPRRQ